MKESKYCGNSSMKTYPEIHLERCFYNIYSFVFKIKLVFPTFLSCVWLIIFFYPSSQPYEPSPAMPDWIRTWAVSVTDEVAGV
jgi:hypothetical protein